MREWGKALEGVSVLIDAFFQNDPYYPRPRVGDSAYNAFKEGYLSAYPQAEGCLNIASSFLTCIEGVQAERDRRVPPAEGWYSEWAFSLVLMARSLWGLSFIFVKTAELWSGGYGAAIKGAVGRPLLL